MSLEDESGEVPSQPSLAARLLRRYGVEVDPRVELPSDPEPAPASTARAAGAASSTSGVIDRLGARGTGASRYRLKGEIARGGMGAILEVFDEDLRRRLAMKVMLDRETGQAGGESGKVSPEMLARFLEEAQVTGQLDHPGVVPVHELGLDEHGQVYFTMRLVHGRDLEAIFALSAREGEGWTRTRAVGVLQKVCEAMAYAHTKGVVHRDLKPANVMVGRFGEVYVMDWGLARVRNRKDRHDLRLQAPPRTQDPSAPAATSARPESAAQSLPYVETDRAASSAAGDEGGLRTMDGSVFGTPSYMPPEQARGEIEVLDERSDVYALGAMLYRLLSGLAPYTAAREVVSPYVLLERVLAGPPTALEVLAPAAPAELVAISTKAMARTPAERYPDMLSLAEDLRAYLEGRVVQAFEGGALAEARKWIRRNRPLAAALAATLVAMIAGLVASLLFAKQASRSADVARREGRIAEEANAFLNNDLLASIAPDRAGVDATVRDVLDQAAQRLDGRFQDEPAAEAALRMTIGTSYLSLGEFEPARVHLERARDLRLALEGPRGKGTLEAQTQIASVWESLGRSDESIALLRATIEIADEALGPEARETLTMQNNLALELAHCGRGAEARALYDTTLATEIRVLGPEDSDTLTTRGNLATLDRDEGHLEEALARQRELLELRRRLQGERHPETLIAMGNVATALSDLGRFPEAEAMIREVLEIRRQVFGPSHPLVAFDMGTLGTVLGQEGRLAESEEVFAEALRISRERYGEDHPQTLQARHNLDVAMGNSGRVAEALELEQGVLAARRRVLGSKHSDTLTSMNSVASLLVELGRLDEAEALFRETLALQREALGQDHPWTLMTTENLAGALFQDNRYAESEALVREVLESRRRVLGAEHPDVAKTTFNLAMIQRNEGKTDEAFETMATAIELLRKAVGNDHPNLALCLQTLGDWQRDAGSPEGARASYSEALGILLKRDPDDPTCGSLSHEIGLAQRALDAFEDAAVSFGEAAALRERVLGPDDRRTCESLYLQAKTLVELGLFEEAEPLALELVTRATRAGDTSGKVLLAGRKLLVELYEAWGKPEEADHWR